MKGTQETAGVILERISGIQELGGESRKTCKELNRKEWKKKNERGKNKTGTN